MDNVHDQNVVVPRRLCFTGSMSTNGSGSLPNTYNWHTGQVGSATGWTVMSAVWGEYRVRSMRVTAYPVYQVNTTAVTIPCAVCACSFVANELYTNIGPALDGMNAQLFPGDEVVVAAADWTANPNAKLWTPVATGAVPQDNRYGIQILDLQATTATASTTVYSVLIEYLVEWRMAA
jgi:hypothetical protein